MKKITALFVALVLCLSLVACGGPDKQPAIDAFNTTSDAFDELVEVINANPDAFDPELVNTMIDMSGLLLEYKELLESDKEFSEEDLASMIEWFEQVQGLVEEIKVEHGIE